MKQQYAVCNDDKNTRCEKNIEKLRFKEFVTKASTAHDTIVAQFPFKVFFKLCINAYFSTS